ncbi:hypothetical protein LTR84_000305 [Exophiala bonariae]|uniref:Signal recognition particle subunit SRP14 n=1 Tax=Exophiala bonariae TaxID=1690606 RepID=A0AAV9NSZ9_9EURO|nr:hypothetical protein LTR84_000305 [Exophiala bonariae]
MSQQERLSNDEFLTRLTTLLAETHNTAHGSIYLTQKPAPGAQPTDAAVDTDSPTSSQILIRVTNGLSKDHRAPVSKPSAGNKSRSKVAATQGKPDGRPKVKLATVVDAVELDAFFARYAEVCKKGMEGLRKRDKKKAKVKAKAKKKGKGGAGVGKATG